jgi:hypothetical protein
MPGSGTCTTAEKIPVTVNPTSASGRPAPIHGPVRVSVQSGPGSFNQDPAVPNVFEAVSGDEPGDTVLVVAADADMGDGEVLIQDTYTLTVTAEQAANFGFTNGAPVPK